MARNQLDIVNAEYRKWNWMKNRMYHFSYLPQMWNWIKKRASSHDASDPQEYLGKDSYHVTRTPTFWNTYRQKCDGIARDKTARSHSFKKCTTCLKEYERIVTSSFLRFLEMFTEFYNTYLPLECRIIDFIFNLSTWWRQAYIILECMISICKFIKFASLSFLTIIKIRKCNNYTNLYVFVTLKKFISNNFIPR